MTPWQLQSVTFRFQLGDWVLFTVSLTMQVRAASPFDPSEIVECLTPPVAELASNCNGCLIRNLPISSRQPTVRRAGDYLCYIPLQYLHCYIDLTWSFEQYLEKFSSKTKSTIQRKIRKYKERCGGSIAWKTYSKPEELPEFFRLATQVSRLTYQERLLDVGLPNTEAFRQEAVMLAASDRLRAFLLFEGDRPVSYLYCSEREGVLSYAYLGYDPDYQSLSVGTVLQWLATERIFSERKFRYFDFTEGNSTHKQLFATHQRLCANVFFVRRTLRNAVLIQAHRLTNDFSKYLGSVLEKFGLKLRVKRFLRRA